MNIMKIIVFILLALGFVGFVGGVGTLLWFGENIDGKGYIMATGVVTLGCLAFPKVRELWKFMRK